MADTNDRCPVCDGPTQVGLSGVVRVCATIGETHGCHGAPVDWRARALAAEAVNASSIAAAKRLADAAAAQERARVVAVVDGIRRRATMRRDVAWAAGNWRVVDLRSFELEVLADVRDAIEAGEHLDDKETP